MANVNNENGEAPIIYRSVLQILVDEEAKRQNHHDQISPSIYMVHSPLRNLSQSSFNPRVIAIGPLHKEDVILKAMEGHKVIYALQLFHRLLRPTNQTMEDCVQRVQRKIGEIRGCYAGKISTYDDVEVAKMMVFDACFVLEYIYRMAFDYPHQGDPIFDNVLVTNDVTRDLLLLENQIPFFVLQDIFESTILKFKETASLTELILSFLKDVNPFVATLRIQNDGADTTYDHILGFLQKSFQPKDARLSGLTVSRFHSITELSRAGVNFKPNHDKKWLLAMEFKASWLPCFFWLWGKPTLKMPLLLIVDYTESVMRNLIAYEQHSPLIPAYITSYAVAMDMLVDGVEDVVKMVESEVIINYLGTNQDAANMINGLCQEINIKDFYYDQQLQQLYSYYSGYWPRNIAWCRRNYFGSPWNLIALLAGIILFVLTVVQTYYAINPV